MFFLMCLVRHLVSPCTFTYTNRQVSLSFVTHASCYLEGCRTLFFYHSANLFLLCYFISIFVLFECLYWEAYLIRTAEWWFLSWYWFTEMSSNPSFFSLPRLNYGFSVGWSSRSFACIGNNGKERRYAIIEEMCAIKSQFLKSENLKVPELSAEQARQVPGATFHVYRRKTNGEVLEYLFHFIWRKRCSCYSVQGSAIFAANDPWKTIICAESKQKELPGCFIVTGLYPSDRFDN